jgi:hypothetical protein
MDLTKEIPACKVIANLTAAEIYYIESLVRSIYLCTHPHTYSMHTLNYTRILK